MRFHKLREWPRPQYFNLIYYQILKNYYIFTLVITKPVEPC